MNNKISRTSAGLVLMSGNEVYRFWSISDLREPALPLQYPPWTDTIVFTFALDTSRTR